MANQHERSDSFRRAASKPSGRWQTMSRGNCLAITTLNHLGDGEAHPSRLMIQRKFKPSGRWQTNSSSCPNDPDFASQNHLGDGKHEGDLVLDNTMLLNHLGDGEPPSARCGASQLELLTIWAMANDQNHPCFRLAWISKTIWAMANVFSRQHGSA